MTSAPDERGKSCARPNKRSEFFARAEKITSGLQLALLPLHEMNAVFWREWHFLGIDNDYAGRAIFVSTRLPIIVFLCVVYTLYPRRWAARVIGGLSVFFVIHFALHVRAYGSGYLTHPFSFGVIGAMGIASFAFLLVFALRAHSVPCRYKS